MHIRLPGLIILTVLTLKQWNMGYFGSELVLFPEKGIGEIRFYPVEDVE
jgi:hypothetical protein